jgi:glutaredoxin 3
LKAIIYSTTTCPWCVKVKDYLASRGVEYDYVNVAEDREAFTTMVTKSGQRGVPVVDLNGTIIIGFDKPSIDAIIGEEA